jgi:putative oxygen-independent coproporphyrinogen III oxidase
MGPSSSTVAGTVSASIVPANGRLGDHALESLGQRPFGVYVHVPFCASRCGYCDFVTYTATELGGRTQQDGYAKAAVAELRLAAQVLEGRQPPVATVFFGGGTPTLLPPADLIEILRAVDEHLGLAPGVEVTIEANPDSVDPAMLAALRAGGFERISFGMQSAATHVLAVLERTHRPDRVAHAVAEARAAGFARINLDLIYGTPGERPEDWARTLDVALATGCDHVSAYALTVEPRTRLAAQVRQGRVPRPDEHALADRYVEAESRLGAAGFAWYELSNWAQRPASQCRHNLLYWRNGDWWGVGPGAHSHIGGTRWSNVTQPAEHARRVHTGCSPAATREVLDPEQRWLEDVLLGVRLADGLSLALVAHLAAADRDRLVADGLVEAGPLHDLNHPRVVLTLAGRQLADLVVRVLTQR